MKISGSKAVSKKGNLLSRKYTALSTSILRLTGGLSGENTIPDQSIRKLVRSDICVLQESGRDTNDAISMMQTALGGLTRIGEILNHMLDLAKKASEDSVDQKMRLQLEEKYQKAAAAITHIAETTEFNGVLLLNGNLADASKNGKEYRLIGAFPSLLGKDSQKKKDPVYIEIADARASALGLGRESSERAKGYSIAQKEDAKRAVIGVEEAIASKEAIRAHLGSLQNILSVTITNLTVQSENLQSAQSRISDIDIANEMAIFVTQQILTKSTVALLTQANPISQMAMTLVR